MADQISGGGIGSDKCLEELVTTTMRGIDNTEEWKLKVGIFWERINERFKIKYQTYKTQVQSKKRHHLHLENSHDLFPNSDRYKGLYEMAANYDLFFWWRLSKCHEKRKKVTFSCAGYCL